MDLSRIPLLAALKGRMQWLTANQKVVAQNIANADTPGYRPKELAAADFGALVESLRASAGPAPSVSLARTNAAHFGPAGPDAGNPRVRPAAIEQSAPDGNAVDLEGELLKMAQTQMDYGLMVDLYRKQVSLLRTALRGAGGNRS
ncbi:MAG: flagellar basal body rod protein FlgB [Rhodothalassiaceae bacterium]